MKRILFALALLAPLLFVPRDARAEVDVSIDFFYNNLGADGSWVEVEDYGYCWQPNVAASNADWRPYSDGYWAYTDVGWTWVSNENFGWATYHYGRWARVRDQGWLWVPGREWGPAWVSWRTGGDQVGWAPLPPRRTSRGGGEIVYEGRAIGGQVDIEFDIGPEYYNFVDIRFIGAPVLRDHIYSPRQNLTYINSTVNVTNITYTNSTVYNYGPDYDRLSAYSQRPIQRLTLQRQRDVDLNAAARSGSLTKVQGDQLLVAAPASFQKPAQPIAPKEVKRKITKADLETGWAVVTDPKAKADLQEKFKKEDPKSIPPPQGQPQKAAAAPVASPAAAVGAAPAPPEKGKGRDKGKAKDATPAPQASPLVPDGNASASPIPADQGKGKGKGKDKNKTAAPAPQANPAVPPVDANATPVPADKGKDKGKGKDKKQPDAVAQPPGPQLTTPPAPAGTPVPEAKKKGDKRGSGKKSGGNEAAAAPEMPAGSAPPASAPPTGDAPRGGKNKKALRDETPAAPVAKKPEPPAKVKGPEKREAAPMPAAAPAPPAAAPNEEKKPGKGNKKGKGDEEASPKPKR